MLTFITIILRNYFFLVFTSVFCIFFVAPANAVEAQLKNIHIAVDPMQSRIILDLSGHVTYHVFTLADPDRLVIDLPSTRLVTALPQPTGDSVIMDTRSGYPKPGILRIVFDLKKIRNPHVNLLRSEKSNHKKLILELNEPGYHPSLAKKNNLPHKQLIHSTPALTEKQLLDQAVAEENQHVNKTPPLPLTLLAPPINVVPFNKARTITVIIDPGHGGKDPGTTGHFGVREKDVVLAVGLDLSRELQRDPRFHVVMTRNSDRFLTLRQRLAVARQNHGDIFIAIHADTFKDPYATGASIYALSSHGASSEAARWLAQKENYSELGGVILRDKSDLLRSVLIDLSQTATISSSLQLGNSLLQQLRAVRKVHNKIVEQAPFMVLKSPDIPSVLVEMGFLSNASEEERLRNPISQAQIADALYAGIVNYFVNNPLPETLLAAQMAGKIN